MTLAAGVVATLVCIVISVLIVVVVHHEETDEAWERVTGVSQPVLSRIQQRDLPPVLRDGKNIAIQVLNPRGQVVSATPQLAGKPPMATFRPAGGTQAERTLCPPAGLRGCMSVLAVRVFQPGGTWLVYIATRQIPWYGNATLLLLVTAASLLMIVLMAGGTSRAVARTLAPVDAIRTELAEISASALDGRLPVPGHQDEIRLLAEAANATLKRLQDAYQQLRQFTSDASHELRSPLTAIKAQTEQALMYPDDTDWPHTATAVLAAAERLEAIIIDLLLLARLDAGASLPREPTDLAQLAAAELDHRGDRVKIVTQLPAGVCVECDRPRITRLLTNLIDNAERHATSQVTVIVRADGPTAVLEVIDDGAGIAAGHREIVFERFARLDTSRDRDAGGSGLGLAIARRIAEAHEGTLTIQDSQEGARFVLRLPRCG
jgi:signal transduction histidine kinase